MQERFTGRAFVVDGDTIRICGTRVRLFGIDAPEASQRCQDAEGDAQDCGRRAASALDALVKDKTVRCEPRDLDQQERSLAICSVNGTDVNAALVDAGPAVAYRQFSERYVPMRQGRGKCISLYGPESSRRLRNITARGVSGAAR